MSLYNSINDISNINKKYISIPEKVLPLIQKWSLSNYNIPEGITKIRPYCFSQVWPDDGFTCTLPSTLTSISEFAFNNCALTEITIPGNVKVIGNSAFRDCALTTLVIEEGVEEIGESAFEDVGEKITSIILPNSIKKISARAFYGVGSSKKPLTIQIGNNGNSQIQFIGEDAFSVNYKTLSFTINCPQSRLEDHYTEDEAVGWGSWCDYIIWNEGVE